MFRQFLKDYGSLVAIAVLVLSYWLNSAMAEGASATQVANLIKKVETNETRTDVNESRVNSLQINDSVQDQKLDTFERVQRKQTEVLEKLAETQQDLQITLIGVQAELKASREARESE